jgi:DNA-binding response OmpR family regulator
MPTALLLSPDDQAVGAISAVLEEMSVTCERPLDGVTAAQKLHSHAFDLVLVDCDNLPAAKLIFDVCRRGKGSNNPVPIAIVDGRAGLPTAFRLGAELILTKPVAKDQARSTIRTAVSRVKKEEPARCNPAGKNARWPWLLPNLPVRRACLQCSG